VAGDNDRLDEAVNKLWDFNFVGIPSNCLEYDIYPEAKLIDPQLQRLMLCILVHDGENIKEIPSSGIKECAALWFASVEKFQCKRLVYPSRQTGSLPPEDIIVPASTVVELVVNLNRFLWKMAIRYKSTGERKALRELVELFFTSYGSIAFAKQLGIVREQAIEFLKDYRTEWLLCSINADSQF
jgi:hypothetical protein